MSSHPIQSYEDLEIWERGMDLAVGVYSVTRAMPPDERFGMTLQMRKAAASVPSNIAEGHGRRAPHDCARFVGYGRGSLMEVRSNLQLATRLTFLSSVEIVSCMDQIAELAPKLTAFQNAMWAVRDQNRRGGK